MDNIFCSSKMLCDCGILSLIFWGEVHQFQRRSSTDICEIHYYCNKLVSSPNDPEGKFSFIYKSSDMFMKISNFLDRQPCLKKTVHLQESSALLERWHGNNVTVSEQELALITWC